MHVVIIFVCFYLANKFYIFNPMHDVLSMTSPKARIKDGTPLLSMNQQSLYYAPQIIHLIDKICSPHDRQYLVSN